MYLYRVLLGDIFSHLTAEQIKNIMIFPDIPYAMMEGENRDIERICLAESIEGCLTSIGWNRLDTTFQDYLDEETDSLRVVILKFKMENLDKKYLTSPEELDAKGCVPDAYITREWWYGLPVRPDEVEIKHLFDYDMNTNDYIIPREVRLYMEEQNISEEDEEYDEIMEQYIEDGIEIPLIRHLVWLEDIKEKVS